MQSFFSLEQGERLSERRRSLPRQNPSFYRAGLAPQSENMYDWLSRHYASWFGGSTEGMSSAYGFKGTEPGVSGANTDMESEMNKLLHEDAARTRRYVEADAALVADANLYVDTTKSSWKYRNTFVNTKGGGISYVTRRGALKSVSPAVYRSVRGRRGCPSAPPKATVSSKDNRDGTVGTDPSFFKGTPMRLNEPCGAAGTNSQVMGASTAALNPQLWDNKNCLQGVNDQFLLQGDIVTDKPRGALEQCHSRAADVGASSFYVRRKGASELTCFVSKPGRSFDQIAAQGTIATVQVISEQPPVAEKSVGKGSGEKEVVGVMNNATIAIGTLSDPGAESSASMVDMDGTVVVPELQDLRRKNCDPIYGSTINVTGATLGNNCRGQKLCSLLNNCSEVAAQTPAAAAAAVLAAGGTALEAATAASSAVMAQAKTAQAEMARRAAFAGS